jgi:hypothetical protein
VAVVMIVVRDATWSVGLFEQVYGWTLRDVRPDPALDAIIVHFRDTPVALAAPEPKARAGWMVERLDRFGEAPAAILLRSSDLKQSARRFPATRAGTWLGRPALWFDPGRLGGTRLGVIEVE